MIGFKSYAGAAVLAAALCLFPGASALAEEAEPKANDTPKAEEATKTEEAPKADVVGRASSPSDKVPIKVDVVDYKRVEGGFGTLKLAGTGLPGLDVHIFVNNTPFALVKGEEGKDEWRTEDQIHLDDKVHEVRILQFADGDRMPAAATAFRLKLTPPNAQDLGGPPPGR